MALGGKDDYPANCELLHYLLMLAFDFTLCPSFMTFLMIPVINQLMRTAQ